jgi:hypothetical protein
MKHFFIVLIITLGTAIQTINAQGCVAIRSNGNTCSMASPSAAKGWQMNLNNRYFKSYKHFVGTIEQKHREEEKTEVINHNYSLDITATRFFNSRWSLSITVPVISNTRSSLYEHGGNSAGELGRHSTQSFGLGDIRVSAYRWLLDPAKTGKGISRLVWVLNFRPVIIVTRIIFIKPMALPSWAPWISPSSLEMAAPALQQN